MPAGLRIVSPTQLIQDEQQAAATAVAAEDAANQNSRLTTSLASFVDGEFSRMVRHRDGANGWSERLVDALRVFNGQYDLQKLQEIKKFGGSEVYARLIATKCRGATSLLRDIYVNVDKPWALEPTPDPKLPDDVIADVANLVQVEAETMTRLGQPPTPEMIRDRTAALMAGARRAGIKKARAEADIAFEKLDDILVEGGFYSALDEALVDISLFPFCVVKGPVVRITPRVTWVDGKAVIENRPVMFWNRVSPFDIWWTPGVSRIEDAAVVEKSRVTRADLNQLLGLPGYNDAAIREVLKWYGRGGYVEVAPSSETERAQMESRESPQMNESGMIDMLEYHGYVQGNLLIDYGMTAQQVPDPLKDYFVDIFKIGRYIIKVQMSPSLKKRPYYYVTSFEKVPGTVVGNALPDILADIGDVTNAALRSLVNNMSIASGPQVVINDDRVAENEDSDELYPWKRWHVVNDPLGNNGQQPVSFFSPQSNAQELLGIYEKFTQIADELSAIPRYITGSERLGGAGRTASGLAMLMGNSAKILQTVAANIDHDIIEPSVSELYDISMLTDTTGMLRGDESINVLGVKVAMQRETQRQRQIEFLSLTANPIDLQITGIKGRAAVLRSVSDNIGLPGEDIVPPDDELKAMAGPGGPGQPPGGPGSPPGAPPEGGAPGAPAPGGSPQMPSAPQGPQTNVVGAAAKPTGANPAQGPG
jgi:hypothetical protein